MSQPNSQPQPNRQYLIGDIQISGSNNNSHIIQGNDNVFNIIYPPNSETKELQASFYASVTRKFGDNQPLWIDQKLKKNQLTSFVARPKELKQIVSSLLESQESLGNITALWGAGGCGKTTLSLVVCYIDKVVKHFKGGVFWVDLGEGKDVLEGMQTLYKQLTGSRSSANTADDVSTEILEHLEQSIDEPYLIVLDDLQTNDELRQFLSCSNSCCNWLITTRDKQSFAGENSVNCLQIDPMKVDESTLLLSYKLHEAYEIDIDNHEQLSFMLKDLVAQLYEFPLLIDLVYKKIRSKTDVPTRQKVDYAIIHSAIRDTFDDFQEKGWNLFSDKLSKVFSGSIKCLSSEKEDLEELVIFPENTPIPISTLKKLWGLTESKGEARRRCENFYGLSFLQKYDPETKTVRMNNILRQYFLQNQEIREKRPGFHKKLLEAYKNFYKISLDFDTDLETIFNNLSYEDNEEKKYMKGFYQYHFERSK